MFDFKLKTEIHMKTWNSFVNDFNLGPKDVLITNRPIVQQCLQSGNLSCRMIYQEEYGGGGEPNDVMINSIIRDLKKVDYDRVIGIGGGTIIDLAKILSLSGFDNVLDVLYGRIPARRTRGLVVVPTTCGTGSEVTSISILEDTTAHVKKGIVSPEIFPEHAVLIPELLKTAPYKVLAYSSLDALTHAVESYLSPGSSVMTELFAVKAMEMILGVYCRIAKGNQAVLYEDNCIGKLLVASTYAGIAFSHSGVGAVHAMSYSLGGNYHVPHGESNYALFDGVLRMYDKRNPTGKIACLKELISRDMGLADGSDAIKEMNGVLNKIAPLKRLKEYGMKEAEIETFADAAMLQERLMKNNYTALARNDIRDIFAELY